MKAIIADIPKTAVYALARHMNERAGREVIPPSVLEKAQSAELRANQKDSDSLPPYDLLDIILLMHAQGMPAAQIAEETGAQKGTVDDVFRRIAASEHKRRMSPPCTRVDANLSKQLVLGK